MVAEAKAVEMVAVTVEEARAVVTAAAAREAARVAAAMVAEAEAAEMVAGTVAEERVGAKLAGAGRGSEDRAKRGTERVHLEAAPQLRRHESVARRLLGLTCSPMEPLASTSAEGCGVQRASTDKE